MNDVLVAQNPWWQGGDARGLPVPQSRRDLQRLVAVRLTRNDRRAIVITGPRQVGKSVLLRQCAIDLLAHSEILPGNVTYFDFSDDRLPNEPISPSQVLEHRPPRFDPTAPRFLLLDEIGRAARWADWLKRTVDGNMDGQLRILATDSAATVLRGGRRESGFGRWDEYRLEGLTYAEYLRLQARPGESEADVEQRTPNTVERFLTYGGFPEHILNESPLEVRERLRSDVVSRAIFQDLHMRRTRSRLLDLERVRDLFVYLMEASGVVLKTQTLVRDLARSGSTPADRRSVDAWLNVLEDRMLITRLSAHGTTANKRLSARDRPKLYASDHGLVNAFARVSDPLMDVEVRSRAFESMVFRHLRSLEEVNELGLSYFREPHRGTDLEVDFVLGKAKGRVLLEAKSSARIRAEEIALLTSAAERLDARRLVCVYGGVESKRIGAVELLPIREFLRNPQIVIGEPR